MKRAVLSLLIVLTIALAAAAFLQTREEKKKTMEVAVLRQELEKAASQSRETTEKIESLENKAQILTAESAALREKLHAASPAVPAMTPAAAESTDASTEKPKGGMADMLGKMFKDPQMKKAMAAQQTMALRQFYSDFVKSSNLTPEQAEQFYNAIGERQMAMMEKAGDFMKGGQQTDEMKRAMEEDTKKFEAQLKEIIGDKGAKQFHDFEMTLPDRIAMNQFSQQLSSGGTPLSADQNRALLQVMSEERRNNPATPAKLNKFDGANMSDEQIQQFFTQQEDVNSRVRTRAMSLLTAEQMKAFEQFQKQQINMQRMGMTMAREMFGGKK